MQYLYNIDAKKESLKLEKEDFKYIVKVRRHRVGDTIFLRNLKDKSIYLYKIESISKKAVELSLIDQRELKIAPKQRLDIGWCIIEPKSIEKSLPFLNEMAVTSITFIYCERSQRNFKIDFKRLEKILINSSQQCGRGTLMELKVVDSLEEFLKLYPNSKMLNFSKNPISSNIKSVVVGCEGGFSDDEIKLFKSDDIIGFSTPLILKSQTAVCAVSSKILL